MTSPPALSGEANRNRQLDALRAVAILLVVAIHAYAYSGLDSGAAGGWPLWLIAAAGVPVFFLVDGFLFATRSVQAGKWGYARYVSASAQRLLVPWLVFATLYLAARASAEAAGVIPEHVVLGKSWLGVARCLYFSCAAAQMYFLLSLFLIRCIAPLSRLLAAGSESMLLVSIGAAIGLHAAYTAVIGNVSGDPILLAIWGLQFHLLGLLLFRHASWIRRHRVALIGALFFVVLIVRGTTTRGDLFAQYAYLVALFALFSGISTPGSILPRIGRETMGIYLLHTPVLMNGISRFASRFVVDPWLLFGIVTLASFASALGATLMLSRLPFGPIVLGRVSQPRGGSRREMREIVSEAR